MAKDRAVLSTAERLMSDMTSTEKVLWATYHCGSNKVEKGVRLLGADGLFLWDMVSPFAA